MTKKHDYEVGYGKPPRHSQFEKGQSGNPKGRPKKKPKSKEKESPRDTVRRVLEQRLQTSDGISMTLFEAMLTQQARKAAKGDTTAFRTIVKLIGIDSVNVVSAPEHIDDVGDNDNGSTLLQSFLERERVKQQCLEANARDAGGVSDEDEL